ncbi:Uncharacterised protein [Pseudomonas fluorescens]|uniref:DoxX family protein n=1 Tax=Pseudomonas fluorescens TaxID=294 RepID=A0A379I922_PSEFL|nr:DoxX family protein [Pseudomonas fluorescens]AIG05024.1 DoxX family protein [Pseudomonas fluorescens]SUD29367.1 Uncharacterised protein [Pseudomonas fluorescens]
MQLSRFTWKALLALILAAFFLVGAVGNIFVSEQIAADYARWGYPDWFHVLTGLLELLAAALLLLKPLRFLGGLVGASIMIAASATVLLHGEYLHSIAPLVVLIIAVSVAWLHRPQRDGKP